MKKSRYKDTAHFVITQVNGRKYVAKVCFITYFKGFQLQIK